MDVFSWSMPFLAEKIVQILDEYPIESAIEKSFYDIAPQPE